MPGIRKGSGGIQAQGRSYIRALQALFPHHTLYVFSKNDDLDEDDELRALGIHFWSASRYPAALRTLVFTGYGLLASLRNRPHLHLTLHLHFLPPMIAARMLVGGKVATVLHGIEAWQELGPIRGICLPFSDRLVAVSRYTARIASEFHLISENRFEVVPNCFENEALQPGPKPEYLLRRHGLTSTHPILLTVSRLDPTEGYKGHEQILRALPALATHFPDIRYVIGGTGPYATVLQAMAQELSVADRVIFVGFIPNDELCAYYQLCDVYAMPSQKEGFGIVFLEAMACGKPIIAGNRDGSVDALDGGRLGVLIDPESPDEVAAAATALLSRSHPNRLLFQPEALHAAAVTTFGRDAFVARVSAALLADDSPPASSPISEPTTKRPIRVTVLTQLTSPYQVEFLNAVSSRPDCELSVVYLTDTDSNRQWTTPEIMHRHLILNQSGDSASEALRWVQEADLAIFNYYTHAFAVKALISRALAHRPWVFWGERPGALQLGYLGALVRHTLLLPLHLQLQPIWGVGQFGVSGYMEEFGDKRPYVNLPYFSSLERFQAAAHAPCSDGIRFLYCGTLSKRKGSDLLASAFLELAREHPQARLILVGHGPLEPVMRAMLEPVASQVDFLGFTPWDELPRAYQRGDVFCFPSRYDGWGLALVEAMAAGLPVISTTRTGAAVEFVQPGVNGWLIPPGDSTALLQAMRSTLTAPLLNMGQKASSSVRSHSLPQGAERFVHAAQAAAISESIG